MKIYFRSRNYLLISINPSSRFFDAHYFHSFSFSFHVLLVLLLIPIHRFFHNFLSSSCSFHLSSHLPIFLSTFLSIFLPPSPPPPSLSPSPSLVSVPFWSHFFHDSMTATATTNKMFCAFLFLIYLGLFLFGFVLFLCCLIFVSVYLAERHSSTPAFHCVSKIVQYPMFNVQMSSVKCQMSNVQCQTPNVYDVVIWRWRWCSLI